MMYVCYYMCTYIRVITYSDVIICMCIYDVCVRIICIHVFVNIKVLQNLPVYVLKDPYMLPA